MTASTTTTAPATPETSSVGRRKIRLLGVAFSAGMAALSGWGLLALLERLTRRALPIWTVTAVVVFLISLGGPMSGEGIGAGNRAVLVLLHAVVAATVITVGRRTSGRRAQA